MKIIKIEKCFQCCFFDYNINVKHCQIKNKCYHIDTLKTGEFRIISTKSDYNGEIPKWCPLEDYK